jgi:hypothetical protein
MDRTLYDTRARVMQAHLNTAFPVISWRVLTWGERVEPPQDVALSPEDVWNLHGQDPHGRYHFVLAPISINDTTGRVAVAVQSAKFFADLVGGSLALVEELADKLAEIIKGAREQGSEND